MGQRRGLALGVIALLLVGSALLVHPRSFVTHEQSAGATSASKIQVSQALRYDSLDQLERDSSAVLLVSPKSAREDTLNGIPITLTDVAVTGSISGSVQAGTITIQQLGTATTSSPQTSELLEFGQRYLIFVQPFHLIDGDETGRFVITGDQGVYILRKNQYQNIGAGSGLPTTIDQEMVSQLAKETP